MVSKVLDAVYENGVFRPLQPVGGDITEGEKVRLRLLTVGEALRALEELAHIYDGLSEEEITEIEKAMLNRGNHSDPRQPEGQPEVR